MRGHNADQRPVKKATHPVEIGPKNEATKPSHQPNGSDGIAPITDARKKELARWEQIFADRMRPFYEWGQALATIKDGKLFRWAHRTFEEYCTKRWRMSRVHAYRLIKAAEVVSDCLSPLGIIPLPRCERQVRPLVGLQTDLVQKIWHQVVNDGEGHAVTTSLVMSAIAKIRASKHESDAIPPNRNKPFQSENNNQSPRDEATKAPSTLAIVDVKLSRQEREILELVWRGMSDKEIATLLGVASHTVSHRQRCLRKRFGARNRTELLFKVVLRNDAPS
jgi:DNA-binding CsgD family transcriptional regulator